MKNINVFDVAKGTLGSREVYYDAYWGKEYLGVFIKTFDRPENLTGLAKFLADNVANTSRYRGFLRVILFNDAVSTADLIREDARKNKTVGGMRFYKKIDAIKEAEKIIKSFDMEGESSIMEDYQFSQFIPDIHKNITCYWNDAAERIKKIATRIVIIQPFGDKKEYII